MAAEFGNGSGLAGLMLALNTIQMLMRKGALSDIEAREIVEQAMLNLETHENLGGEEAREVIREARSTLESIRGRL